MHSGGARQAEIEALTGTSSAWLRQCAYAAFREALEVHHDVVPRCHRCGLPEMPRVLGMPAQDGDWRSAQATPGNGPRADQEELARECPAARPACTVPGPLSGRAPPRWYRQDR